MRIISERVLREFGEKYSDTVASLDNWKRIVRQAKWASGADVKMTFSNSDLVGEKTVFNISLNRYRLIAFISFRSQIVYVKTILTHKQYEQGNWKK